MTNVEQATWVSIENLRKNIKLIVNALNDKKTDKNAVLYKGGLPLIYGNMVMNVIMECFNDSNETVTFDTVKEAIIKMLEDESVNYRVIKHLAH